MDCIRQKSVEVETQNGNPSFQLVIYPTDDDKHGIGFIEPATLTRPASIKGLLKFGSLEQLETHANKILETVKFIKK